MGTLSEQKKTWKYNVNRQTKHKRARKGKGGKKYTGKQVKLYIRRKEKCSFPELFRTGKMQLLSSAEMAKKFKGNDKSYIMS